MHPSYKNDPSLGKEVHAYLVKQGLETPMTDQVKQSAEKKIEAITDSFSDIMIELGLDTTDDSLMDTPKRVAKMYVNEIFYGLNYVIRQLESEDRLLIVDDVHDTGNSIAQIINDITSACKKNTPDIKVATPYYKPNKSQTGRKPDYYIHETDQWLVFPHELEGLSLEEIEAVSYTHLRAHETREERGWRRVV